MLLLLIGGCSSIVSVPPPTEQGADEAGPLQQRLVIVVHGDAAYRYHMPDGSARAADEETLEEAFSAAQSMPRAEVFVFHQRPHDPFLGLIPRDDGTMYHFRGGRLRHQTSYEQIRSTPLSAEAALLRTHRAPTPDSSLFTAALYYGHAVPKRAHSGYHRSRPDVAFGVQALAKGFGRLSASGPFDAIVLSTCDGGTPHTVAALSSHTRFLLASPGDLHLSFIDADLLPERRPSTPSAWTHRLAEQAFARLTDRVTTAVTLATYDLEQATPAARALAQETVPDTSTTPTGARHHSCQTVLNRPVDTTGVRVWDRPARFGPQADRPPHSGWGCRPTD